MNNLTFISANSRRQLDSFITTEFFHNPNIQNEENVVLLGDYDQNTAELEFVWKWNGKGSNTALCFAEYDKRDHSLQLLARFSVYIEQQPPQQQHPHTPPTLDTSQFGLHQHTNQPLPIPIPNSPSPPPPQSQSASSSSAYYTTHAHYQSQPPSHEFKKLSLGSPQRVVSHSPTSPIIGSYGTSANAEESIDIVMQREKQTSVPRPDGDSTQPEDGPLFRATIASLEKKTGNLKSRTKKLLKRAMLLQERQQSLVEAHRLFNQSLKEIGDTDMPSLQPLIYKYFDKEHGQNELVLYLKQCSQEMNSRVIEPLRRLYELEIKAFDVRKREFDDESNQYYSWLSRYLSMKQEAKGKKKVESDSKYLEKRKAFELCRFDYYSYMQDLHGGRKQQDVVYQMALYAESELNRLIDAADCFKLNTKPNLDSVVEEVKDANKDWSRQRTEREVRRRALERSVVVAPAENTIKEHYLHEVQSPTPTTVPSLKVNTEHGAGAGYNAPPSLATPDIASASSTLTDEDYNSALATTPKATRSPNSTINNSNNSNSDYGNTIMKSAFNPNPSTDTNITNNNSSSATTATTTTINNNVPSTITNNDNNSNSNNNNNYNTTNNKSIPNEYNDKNNDSNNGSIDTTTPTAAAPGAASTGQPAAATPTTQPNTSTTNNGNNNTATNDELKKEGLLWAMSRPGGISDPIANLNKAGWHKFWVVLAGGKLCEYTNWKQGVVDLHNEPINLKVAHVREARNAERRFCFEVVTPNYKRVYQATNDEDMQAWIRAINNGITSSLENFPEQWPKSPVGNPSSESSFSISQAMASAAGGGGGAQAKRSLSRSSSSTVDDTLLQIIRASSSNLKCADCGSANKCEWMSINLLVVLCIDCSGVHRSLGSHISKIRSLTLDTVSFNSSVVDLIKSVDNDKMNAIWEKKLLGQHKPTINESNRAGFITEKYVEKKFVEPLARPNAHLRTAVTNNDLLEAINALASRANPNTLSSEDEADAEPLVVYALRLASSSVSGAMAPSAKDAPKPRKAVLYPMCELLLLNSATLPTSIPPSITDPNARAYISKKLERETSNNSSSSITTGIIEEHLTNQKDRKGMSASKDALSSGSRRQKRLSVGLKPGNHSSGGTS